MSDATARWLVFALDGARYALPLETVQRVVRAVFITPLPLAPAAVAGAIDVHGAIVPTFDLRSRFGLPSRPVRASDHLLIAATARRTVALIIDCAEGVVSPHRDSITRSAAALPELTHVSGLLALGDGLVLIQDLERLLSDTEARALDHALDQRLQHAS